MNFYLNAFGTFFKIGLFTIGGGYAMVPLIEEEVIHKKKWLTQEEFIDLLAVSQSVPGVFAVNFSIFIGYKLRKFPGALALALGAILPSFLIILAIALFFHQFKEYEAVENIFKGIRPAVVALIALICAGLAVNLGRELLMLVLYALTVSVFCMTVRRLCQSLAALGTAATRIWIRSCPPPTRTAPFS